MCKAHRRGNGGMPRAERERGRAAGAGDRTPCELAGGCRERKQEPVERRLLHSSATQVGIMGVCGIARGLRAIACGKRSPHRGRLSIRVKSDGP